MCSFNDKQVTLKKPVLGYRQFELGAVKGKVYLTGTYMSDYRYAHGRKKVYVCDDDKPSFANEHGFAAYAKDTTKDYDISAVVLQSGAAVVDKTGRRSEKLQLVELRLSRAQLCGSDDTYADVSVSDDWDVPDGCSKATARKLRSQFKALQKQADAFNEAVVAAAVNDTVDVGGVSFTIDKLAAKLRKAYGCKVTIVK